MAEVLTRAACFIGIILMGWLLRQALAILFLSPVSNSAVAFTAELKGDFGLSSAINSLSMLISIGLIVGALVVLL